MTATGWQEVGDRVYVRRYELLDQSIGAIVGRRGLLVVDTRGSHRLADELRADLRRLSHLPPVAVANTHGHWDHVFGNARFRPSPIWGHVRCARMVEATAEYKRQVLIESSPEHAQELNEVELTPPDRTFEDRVEIDLGDRRVVLSHLGSGHTDNDIIVDVSDASVVFAGDLLENGAPPVFNDAYPQAWATTAAALARRINGTVVPGHGNVADRRFAEKQAAELRLIAELSRAVVAGQIGIDELECRSPYPTDTTRTALERTRLELQENPLSGKARRRR